MKTKPFLLATAGSTVDGRTIDDKMIEQMASSYDPKTYGSRVNIEHIRGIAPDGPFRAYGDILELSVGEADVNFNGKTEKRKALFGVFDVTDEAKKLNEASQKVYPSIEIEPNFAGKGFAYCMGVALTDTPASIATDRLEFNRKLPGALHLSADNPRMLEFAEDEGSEAAAGFLGSMKSMLDDFAAKFKPTDQEQSQHPAEDKGKQNASSLDFAALRPLLENMSDTFSQGIAALRGQLDESDQRFAALKKQLDEAPDNSRFSKRPPATGAQHDGDFIY